MNNMKYRVYMVCFDYYLQDMFNTKEEAVIAGKKTGFEFRIDEWSK